MRIVIISTTNRNALELHMQATLTNASPLCFAASGQVVSAPAPATSGPHTAEAVCATAAVDSSTLLQGQKAVAIRHNGSVYSLQATKLGKLILTK